MFYGHNSVLIMTSNEHCQYYYSRYYYHVQFISKRSNSERLSYLHKVTQLMNSGTRIQIYSTDSTAWFFPRIPLANRQVSKWLLHLLPCSNLATSHHFHFVFCPGLVGGKASSLRIGNSIKNKDAKGHVLGCSLHMLAGVVVRDGPWERSVLGGTVTKASPLHMPWRGTWYSSAAQGLLGSAA